MNSNLIALILIFLLSCSNNNFADLKDYFFPLQDLSNKKVYIFTSDNEQLDGFYWTLEKSNENGKTAFYTMILNEHRKPTYEVIEHIQNDGVDLKEIRFPAIRPGQSDIVSTINQTETFKWVWKRNQKIACEYYTPFQSNGKKLKQVVFRQKEFIGQSDSVKLFDKKHSTVKFRDSINVKVVNVNTGEVVKENNTIQYSYWAEGIGLFRYERPDGNLTLSKITDYKDWNK